ncbi:PAS domain-containing protein (plasmid) [Pseudomonas sp. HR96]|uniref:PAS domain-containing protein n=1 Tax=Pseudomonas sp. HR96 TaxID=1027966 RepID=UPI002A74C01F|nr:PAS domain-containing protein [Pseudomonas sp. HR96]WPP02460.1 PAS domain-containing protein [Pseudomonas sp. HR96]
MPMLQDGHLIGVIKILRDITDRIETEKRTLRAVQQLHDQFQEIADTIPQLVWISDMQGQDLYFNRQWLTFSGRSHEQLTGNAWQTLIPQVTRERVARERAQAIQNLSAWEDTFQMHDGNGQEHWFLCRALPIRNDAGQIVRWFSTCTDVDAMHKQSSRYEQDAIELRDDVRLRNIELSTSQGELKKSREGQAAAEDQVRQLQKMEAVGQLTGGIAHDFNNMLTIVVGGLHLLKTRLARGEQQVEQFIELALDGTTRATQLTHRLLAFSRQMPLSPEPVDLNGLVTGMSDMLQRTLGSNIKLEFVRHAGLWPVFADFGSLEQALLNLCFNARDAMSDGGRITVETGNAYVDDSYASQEQIEAGEYAMVAVSDTGDGIPPEVLARVFEPYFTTKDVGKGTGLGLAQVYGFAKQSRGHIKLYSELGFGTSAKVYLPRYLGDAQPSERLVLQDDHLPRATEHECVLVVEDDLKVRMITLELLRELGYQLLEAGSGKAALQILDEHPEVTVLFTDVVMPEMTGKQLADKVNDSKPRLPVLYTTGYTRNAIVHNGMLDRGVALLPKPFTLRELALKLRQVLDR